MKNLGQLMKQAQAMQTKMAEMQEKLETIEVSGSAGAGMVAVTLNGKGAMRSVKIDPSLAKADEIEILEDLIASRPNAAIVPSARAELNRLRGPS